MIVDDIAQAYKEAGAFAYLSTFVGAAAVAIGWRRKTRDAWTWAMPMLPLLLGVLGYFVGMNNVQDAVDRVSPEQRMLLSAAGQLEALKNIYIGGAWAVLALVPLLVKRR